MKSNSPPAAVRPFILIAEDDPDDRLLALDAMEEASFSQHHIGFVNNGEELMDYLKKSCASEGNLDGPGLPLLILLDLNMPKKDGREALKEIKSHPDLKKIPVIILTTSQRQDDINQSYDLGANTYMLKPVTYEELVQLMGTIKRYWKEHALLSK